MSGFSSINPRKGKYNELDQLSLLWDIEEVKPFQHMVRIYDPARKEIRNWPSEVKKGLGSILTLLQLGEIVGMPDVKYMPSVARGAAEIRIKDSSGIYRAFLSLKLI